MPNAQLSVRNVDRKIVDRLKARAKKHGRSLESEIRQILGEAVVQSEATATVSRSELAAQIRAQFAGRHFSDSTDIIRRDRDSR